MSKKIIKYLLIVIILGIAAMVIRYSIATTPAIRSENGIASLEKVKIGGVDQWLLIRGKDLTKPVLLFLHGGPGFDEMVFSRQINGGLEDNFITVGWDQRGSGKSYNAKLDKITLSSDQLLLDTNEIVQYLKNRFHKNKIFLIGHSWGSYLGLETVRRNPQDFYAYIGMGQLINGRKGEILSYEWTKSMAILDKNEEAVKQLEALNFKDGIYKNGMEEKHVEREWLWHYKGFLHNMSYNKMYFYLVKATEYNINDKINFIEGIDFSEEMIGTKWLDNLQFDKDITSLKLPVFFIQGKYDYNVPSQLVKEFCETVDAPMKEYIEFENSAHVPNYEEPDKFEKEMLRIANISMR